MGRCDDMLGVGCLRVMAALAAIAAIGCGEAKSSSKADGGSSGGSDGTAGKGNAGANGVDGGSGGASGSAEQGGKSAEGGSAQGGVAQAGASSQGGKGGETVTGGAGLGEKVCSSDPKRCFDVIHQQWEGDGNAGVDGVAFDSKGNLVVAASTLGQLEAPESLDNDDFLINWSPNLEFMGAQQQSGISRALALDSNDNAFRVGVLSDGKMSSTAGLDLAITKSAPDGTETWRKVLASPQYDEARAMATDGDGNCYVGGFTFGQVGDGDTQVGEGDALLIKLAPDGERLWAHQFGSTGLDVVESVCTDSAGNTYVTGGVAGTFASVGQGDNDLFIAKFSPTGERLWEKQIGSAALDTGTGVACGADFIYVVGLTKGRLDDPQGTATSIDLVLLKYDAAGNQVWLQQWLTTGNESYSKVAIGLEGTAVVASASATDLDGVAANGPGGNNDLFVSEWSANGDPLWTYQWGSDSWDSAMAVAVSPTGRIAVGAMTQEALPQFSHLNSGGGVLSVFTPR